MDLLKIGFCGFKMILRLIKNLAICVSVLVVLAACAKNSPDVQKAGVDLIEHNRNSRVQQRPISQLLRSAVTKSDLPKSGLLLASRKQSHLFAGNAPLARAATYSPEILTGKVHLNYVDIDIKQATRSILNDILKKGFVIDQSLAGNVNIKTIGPVSKRKALSLLEDVLNQHDAHIVQEGSLYKVSRKGRHKLESITTGSVKSESLSGTRVVRLNHITSTEMAAILEPYAGDGILSIDKDRNALVLSGSSSEFRSWLETIRTFDVDWLAGKSVGVFKIDSIGAAKMIEGLRAIMKNENTEASAATFTVIEANNSVLAIAKTPEILRSIKLWVTRLEEANGGAVKLYTYNMKFAQATSAAPILADLFDIKVSSPGEEVSANPVVAEANGEGRASAAQAEFGSSPEEGVGVGKSGARIVANQSSNSLLIFANKEKYESILAALRTIDVPEKQVLVEAVIVEVTLTEELRHGVQFAIRDIGNIGFDATLTNSPADLSIAPQVPGFSLSIDTPIQAIIDALDSVTNVNVVSSPNLMVLNNKTATLSVGNQIPIATQTRSDALEDQNVLVNTVEFRDTGVIFDVTPRINSNQTVLLDIVQEISSVGPSGATLTPTISQRKFSSSISVNNGETVVLGGLFSNSKSKSKTGVPGLSKIPGVGNLFGSTNNSNVKTELLVLISPKIIKNSNDARAVAEELSSRIEQLRDVDIALESIE